MQDTKALAFSPGYITITEPGGNKTAYPIADLLRVADIPIGLTYTQVAAISKLANLIVVLIRTLIDRQVLNESFLENDDFDLDAIIQSIEQMGGSYEEPDIAVANE